MSHRDRTFPRPRQTPLKQVRAGWRSHAIPFLEARSRWASLYTVVLILATQRPEYQLAQLREQLTLELASLSEQETAKVIQLLEESRRDNPLIRDRVDQEAEAIAQPAHPQWVLDAIKETHAAAEQIAPQTPSRRVTRAM